MGGCSFSMNLGHKTDFYQTVKRASRIFRLFVAKNTKKQNFSKKNKLFALFAIERG